MTNLRGREPRNHRIEIRMNQTELETLEAYAFLVDRPISGIIRLAVRLLLEQEGATHGNKRRTRRPKA